MTATLAERFIASNGQPIEVAGSLVHLRWEIRDLAASTRFEIRLEANGTLPQALCIDVIGKGQIEIAGVASRAIELWSDTAPPAVTAQLSPHRSNSPLGLRFWNAWRDERGVKQFGIGNFGIRVDQRPSSLELQCSDGRGEVDFQNLRVTATWM